MFHAGAQGDNDDFTNSTSWLDVATGTNATAGGNGSHTARRGMGAVSNAVRGVYASGYTGTNYIGVMDYFTLANRTTASGTDFGDLQENKYYVAGAQDATRGLFVGGANGGLRDTIDYITVDTASNGTNFGDLQEKRLGGGGAGDAETGRAYFWCGMVPNSTSGSSGEKSRTSEYVSVQTLSNASFGGNLTDYRQYVASCSGD